MYSILMRKFRVEEAINEAGGKVYQVLDGSDSGASILEYSTREEAEAAALKLNLQTELGFMARLAAPSMDEIKRYPIEVQEDSTGEKIYRLQLNEWTKGLTAKEASDKVMEILIKTQIALALSAEDVRSVVREAMSKSEEENYSVKECTAETGEKAYRLVGDRGFESGVLYESREEAERVADMMNGVAFYCA